MNKNKKSYRRKYTYYYVLTLAIPIIVILFVNVLIQKTVRQQVIEANERTLKQFFYLMDEKVDIILDDAYKIIKSTELDEYAKLDEKSVIVEFSQKVSGITLLNKVNVSGIYDDIFAWFPYNGGMLSGKNPIVSATTLETYCDTYYNKNESMKGYILDTEKHGALHPVFWQIDNDDNERILGLSLSRYKVNSELHNYVIALIINNNFLTEGIENGILTPSDNAMLFNKDGALLFSNRENRLEVLPEGCRTTGMYEIELEGEACTLLVEESQHMEGFYTLLISQEDFYKPLIKTRIISLIGACLSIVLGSIVAYKMSQNTYRPLEEILQKIEDSLKQCFDEKNYNEFEFIAEVIHQQKEEHESDRAKKQEEIDTGKRKEYLLAVLEGRMMREADVDWLETQLDETGSFYVGHLYLKNAGEIGWDLLPFVIDNVFTEKLAPLCNCEVLSVSGANYFLVLHTKSNNEHQLLLDALQQSISFLQEKCGAFSVLGISNEGQDIYELRKLNNQAELALNYKFLLSKSLIQYKDIQERQFQLPFWEKNGMFHMVLDYLDADGSQKCSSEEFIKNLASMYKLDQEPSVQNAEYFCDELTNVLKCVILGKEFEDVQHRQEIDSLLPAESLEEYLEKLTSVLNILKADKKESDCRKNTAVKIKKYIEMNYTNPDLNVSLIGEVFGMQAAYLSQMFREEYGILLLNYIAYVRIDHAKQLLSETNLTIGEVAQEVGFLSSGVFIKAFKKILGTTPGKYRQTGIH